MLKTSASIHTITLYISIIRVEEIFTHVFVHACMPVHVDMWVSGGRGARGKGGAGEGVGGGGQGGGGGAIYLEHSKSAFTQKRLVPSTSFTLNRNLPLKTKTTNTTRRKANSQHFYHFGQVSSQQT